MADNRSEDEKRKDRAQGMLGTGAAANAAKALRGRKQRLDDLENDAMGTPAPQPSEGQHGQADRSQYNWDNSPPKRH